MIVKTFPLVRPGVFVARSQELHARSDEILVKPQLLSICAADQRYYFGLRPAEVLQKKMPMILIHEAMGVVLSSCHPHFKCGDKVVLLPCGCDAEVDSNYQSDAYFRSSNAPGFCQELMSLNPLEVVRIPENEGGDVFVFSELLSVCFQAVRRVQSELSVSQNIAIWGDGALGYLMSYLLKSLYPRKRVISICKHEDRAKYFWFADGVEMVFSRSKEKFDLLIECVGGAGAQNAIKDILESAVPKATILLTGVSENPPSINTRLVLEKGLSIKGTTRSVREDFVRAVDFICNESHQRVINVLESERYHVRNENDLKDAFEKSKSSVFKTVIEFMA